MQRTQNSQLATQTITAVLLFGIAFAAAGAEQMMRALPAPAAMQPISAPAAAKTMAAPTFMQPMVVAPAKPPSPNATMLQKKLTPQQLRDHIAKKALKVMTGQKMANPRSTGKAQTIIAALRTQKQAGDSERTAIMSSTHKAGVGVPGLTPSHTMSDPVPIPSPIGASTSIGSRSSAMAVMRAQPAQAPRDLAGSGMAFIGCHDSGQSVRTVNKLGKGAIFTPDPQFNRYTIKGCGFGNTQGQAHLYGNFAAGQVALQIEFWSDEEIDAKVDSQITGELDQDNVTLVVVPSGAPQVQKPGFKFYAMRETTLLTKIPMSWVSLAQVASSDFQYVDFGPGKPSQYLSPTTTGTFPGKSAEVSRQAGNIFPGGQDLFDFSKLRPGFTTESMLMNNSVLTNEGCESYQVNGNWNAEWVGDNIRVSWQMQHCHLPPGIIFPGDFNDLSISDYALSVWVSGPRGVSPWLN